MEGNKETLGFQTEVRQLLDLMIHSLYSNKEIFLRELISNASDAADKLRFEALSDDALYEGDGDLAIHISFDEKARTVTVRDNGIGMSREEVIENIGTIAKSGTRHFFEALTGDQAKDAQLIGQFGVGFYSCFIVADEVTLRTRKAGSGAADGVVWRSSGEGEYTIESTEIPSRGTEVVLHLKDGEDEFLNSFGLRSIITRYSDHISFPIYLPEPALDADADADADADSDAESDEDGTSVPEPVNRATAVWTRPRSDVSDEEYEEFYKHVSHDFEGPLETIHSRVEGNLEYTALLFVPKRAPFDLWDRNTRRGVKLYVKRVFIMDDAENLMPPYLRFVRGVIDSADLPLNVSREILQANKQVDAMRAGSVRRVLGALERMANNDAEKYATFWGEFGQVLKEGIIDDAGNRDDIAKLLRFVSTASEGDAPSTSLGDYIERMKEGQDAIYYITADNLATARNSPHLEIFAKKGIEVLLLTDSVDEWVVTHLSEFSEKKLRSVAKGDVDLEGVADSPDAEAGAEAGDDAQTADEEMKPLVEGITEALGERVKEVRISKRLTTSPACLIAEEHEMGAHLERILKAAGQDIGASKPILEINAGHPIVKRMGTTTDDAQFADWAHVLHDQAVLSEGGQLEDPAAFVRRLNDLFQSLA